MRRREPVDPDPRPGNTVSESYRLALFGWPEYVRRHGQPHPAVVEALRDREGWQARLGGRRGGLPRRDDTDPAA